MGSDGWVVRLFVALPLPPSPRYLEVAKELQDRFGARLVPEGSWHVTLCFLGEVDDETPVVEVLQWVLADWSAGNGAGGLDVVVRGVGAFPDARRARVAWAGIEAAGLDALATAIRDALPGVGMNREFHAHATLARFASARDISQVVAKHKETCFAQGIVGEVHLLRSELGPSGPAYVVLARFPLAPSSTSG